MGGLLQGLILPTQQGSSRGLTTNVQTLVRASCVQARPSFSRYRTLFITALQISTRVKAESTESRWNLESPVQMRGGRAQRYGNRGVTLLASCSRFAPLLVALSIADRPRFSVRSLRYDRISGVQIPRERGRDFFASFAKTTTRLGCKLAPVIFSICPASQGPRSAQRTVTYSIRALTVDLCATTGYESACLPASLPRCLLAELMGTTHRRVGLHQELARAAQSPAARPGQHKPA